jgi:hypothetical protein
MSCVPILDRSARPRENKGRGDPATSFARWGAGCVARGLAHAYFVDHFSATISASSYEYLIR